MTKSYELYCLSMNTNYHLSIIITLVVIFENIYIFFLFGLMIMGSYKGLALQQLPGILMDQNTLRNFRKIKFFFSWSFHEESKANVHPWKWRYTMFNSA